MKAAVIKKVGEFEVRDVPEPQVAPDGVKVKIKYCGVCGTDPEILEDRFGLMKGRPPLPDQPALNGLIPTWLSIRMILKDGSGRDSQSMSFRQSTIMEKVHYLLLFPNSPLLTWSMIPVYSII